MQPSSGEVLDVVIVYAEKPLVQTKDGNITFNAGESPLSAGSNASELLDNVPLVSKDPTGKIMVRGKEPRILIDDKPVELNMQQLQDLLESMPGSSIEKIEVLTNPPPQYANEQGGVINIVTKKGTVGISGRLNVFYGTRDQAGINGSFTYRKQGLSFTVNAGTAYNQYEGFGYSNRENIYQDSTNQFNTKNNYLNESMRPNFRANLQYDMNKLNSFSVVLNYNQNNFDNNNYITYLNINRFGNIYRLRQRSINSTGDNYNPSVNFSYTLKTKKAGESLKLFANYNYSDNSNLRDFVESFLNPDYTKSGNDSLQQQMNLNLTTGYNFRLQYDAPIVKNKTFLSLGSSYAITRSEIDAEAYYKKFVNGEWIPLPALTNNFIFRQQVKNLRGSIKQVWNEKFSTTAGLAAEETTVDFELLKYETDTANRYWSYLPFATMNKTWNQSWNLSLAYRRTIRRPGIREQNPTIDFSDPFNVNYGNPGLKPSLAHNFDLVIGRNKNEFNINFGTGFNVVEDVFSTIRTRVAPDTTHITWQNISARKEYEISSWSGYKFKNNIRVNISASYVYNVYGALDKLIKHYRDGGSLTSNLNLSYSIKDLYTFTGNFTYNRFANPQGNTSSNVNMNIGLQGKFIDKKLVFTLNIIDPFAQQQNHSFTYGTNFILENFNQTTTRNFRFSLAYVFRKSTPSKAKPKASGSTGKEKLDKVLSGS
jgi:outer membrane receptor protein involved in Fe transport